MSKIKVDTWENSSGLENFPCTAWVNFNGTGTVAIRDSGNVSSITDTGVGRYTVNFATVMNNANYSASVTVSQWHLLVPDTQTTSGFDMLVDNGSFGVTDSPLTSAQIFGGR